MKSVESVKSTDFYRGYYCDQKRTLRKQNPCHVCWGPFDLEDWRMIEHRLIVVHGKELHVKRYSHFYCSIFLFLHAEDMTELQRIAKDDSTDFARSIREFMIANRMRKWQEFKEHIEEVRVFREIAGEFV